MEARLAQGREVGLTRNEAAHAANGIFDAALLPRRIGIAEEGLNIDAMEPMMACELGAVVEGDGPAQVRRQHFEERQQLFGDRLCGLIGRPGGKQDAALALMHGEHGLTVFGEQHQVGFPMTCGLAVGHGGRPLSDGNTAFDQACRAAAPAATQAALALAARQIVPPAVVFGAGDLGVDEAVDALVADHGAPGLAGQATGDLLGRPAFGEPLKHCAAQLRFSFEARARPAPRSRLFLGVTGFVTDVTAAIALELARDGRRRAIQSCRDLPDRAANGLNSGNLTPLLQ